MPTKYPKYLEKETYRRVLSVARSYYDDLNKIKQIENDYIFMSSQSQGAGSKNSNISDPTFNKAYQIQKHTKLLKQRTNAVQKTLSKFTNKEQEIIKQNVFENIPIIYCNITKCERSVQTLRHDFLVTLAAELGETI